MLAFSRKQVMQQKLIEVKETLADTQEMLGQLLGRQVALRFEIAAGLPPILADPDMFHQIIVNLVVNARDAMSSGGKLTIRADLATFAAADISARAERRAGPFIRLSVSDTGSGMDNAVVKHLFEPFFTTKDVGKGMGLGLATVHGMVNQNQGWIEVESEIGKGTTFDIYFPVAAQAAQAAKEAEKKPVVPLAVGGKETVLIVEDEEVLREMLREILTASGYHVLEAANGLQAVQLWDENHSQIELLLTDNVFPDGMTGLELAAKLREGAPGLPVIFSSGCSQEALLAKQDNPTGCSFLSKPYRPAQLIQAVRNALDAGKAATSLAASAQAT
jgi:CheY-like chemotaxis protein